MVPAFKANAADFPAGFEPAQQEKFIPAGAKLELLWNEGEFTEGPAAAPDGSVLFTDIGDRILRFDGRTGKVDIFRQPSGKANGLVFDCGKVLIACEGAAGGNRRVSFSTADGKSLAAVERWNGKRFNSPNDLDVDSKGNVYFTDPRYGGDEPRELDFEGVFLIRREANGTCFQVDLATKDVQKPNGILVSPDDKTVYVADSNSDPLKNHQLVAFVVQSDGALGEKRLLFDFGPNRRGIDGMAMDSSGNIYATGGKGEAAGVYVFDPAGKPLAFLALPGDPTNCVFGVGPESHYLYIAGAGPKPEPGMKRRYGLYRVLLPSEGRPPFKTS
jgi:gluconolactonase